MNEQSAGYYPYGEPWREPEAGNPYLFGGKERVTLGGLGMFTTHAAYQIVAGR